MLITLKLLAKYLNSHLVVKHPYTFKPKARSLKMDMWLMDVPVATNVASKEILLDTAALEYHILFEWPFTIFEYIIVALQATSVLFTQYILYILPPHFFFLHIPLEKV